MVFFVQSVLILKQNSQQSYWNKYIMGFYNPRRHFRTSPTALNISTYMKDNSSRFQETIPHTNSIKKQNIAKLLQITILQYDPLLIQIIIIVKIGMNHQDQKKLTGIPKIEPVKFIQRSNGTIKGYSVNTFHGLVKNYNEDRVSIIMNITKPNFKGRWPRCSYFGVFDGHGGNKCSDFLKENMHKYITENSHFPHQPIEALKFGFKKAEQQFLTYAESQNPVERSGSCAIVLLIIDEICYIANVGDSRAILSTNKGKTVYAISKDHKPDSETQKQRIFQAGGKIYQSSLKNKHGNTVLGPFRIEPGKLSVSRSFGDIEAKLPKYNGNPKVLIAKPEITYFQIDSMQHDFVVMCSDGIYDKLSNEEIADCFWQLKDKNIEEKYNFIGNVPSKIIQRSMEKMSMDNLTSLIIVFEDEGRLLLPAKKNNRAFEKEITRRFPTSNEQQNQKSNRPKPRQENSKRSIKTYSKIEEVQSTLESDREHNGKQDRNRQTGKQNNRDISSNREAKQNMDRIVKRKSTATIPAFKNQQLQHVSQSLSNSISAKMLAGSKVLQHQKSKLALDKVSMNELMQKKKTIDTLLKDNKESLWKQLTSNPKAEIHDKLIR